MIDDGGGNYTGKLVRIYKKRKYFHTLPGERVFSAVKTGPNHYTTRIHVKLNANKWTTVGTFKVIVDGETARAEQLIWKRVKE